MTTRDIIALLELHGMDKEVRLEVRHRGESMRAWAVDGGTYEKDCVYLWGRLSERRQTDAD